MVLATSTSSGCKRMRPQESMYSRKKTYTKKKETVTPARVRAITRKTLLGLAETKRLFNNNSRTLLNSQWYSWNIFYQLGQGTGDGARIGDEIFAKSYSARISFQSTTATVNAQQTIYRVLVVKTNYQIDNGIIPNPVLFPPSVVQGGNFMLGWVDPDKFTVMYDERHVMNPMNVPVTAANQYQYLDIYVPFNKKIQYEGNNSGYSKSDQYYVLVAAFNLGNVATTLINFEISSKLEFKDV